MFLRLQSQNILKEGTFKMKRRFKSQSDKRPVKDGLFSSDEVLPGDGVDPRLESKEVHKIVNRKALQLCAQVMDALNLALPALSDDMLRELYVYSVIPAPDSSQLLVTVIPAHMPDSWLTRLPGEPYDVKEIAERLQRANGKLRSEVAISINRKRVPQLKFVVK